MGNQLSNFLAELSQLDPIPMEDLIATNREWRERYTKHFGILTGVSGFTSAISFSTLIWKILRSHDGISTTQHRLLLGLCICDIFSSSADSSFNSMVSSEISYAVWNTRGNEATCNAHGFIITFGVLGGLYYNATLNLYYLTVVKYEKSDEYIRSKIEPFLHSVPITISLIGPIIRLIGKHFNADGFGTCVDDVYYPSHCHGYDVGEIRDMDGFDIPCGRGLEGAMHIYVSAIVLMIATVVIIIVSLGLIYTAVRKQETEMRRYGIGSLRTISLQQSLGNNTVTQQYQDSDQVHPSFLGGIRTYFIKGWSSLVSSMTTSKTKLTKSKNQSLEAAL